MVLVRSALCAVALAACASLPDVPANVCGNGVIDVGEDCDGGASCSQCSITCDSTACPDGYECGFDQLCHAPSGVFRSPATSSFGFPVFTGLPADVNGDGIDDVVGVSTASIVVTYGEAHGQLSEQVTQVTPAHGEFGFAKRSFGGGNSSELLAATPDGIAGFAVQSRLLLPYPFANSIRNDFQSCAPLATGQFVPLDIFGFDGGHLNLLVRDTVSNDVWFGVLDVVSGNCGFQKACGMKVMLGGAAVPTVQADTYRTGALSELVEIALEQPMTTSFDAACVMRATVTAPTVPGAYTIDQVGTTWSNSGVPAKLARITSAACPWLVVGGNTLTAYAPAVDAGGCTLSQSTVTIQAPSSATPMAPTGRIALAPAVTGSGPEALVVTSVGGPQGESVIFAISTPVGSTAATTTLYQSTAGLLLADAADLDGDGVSEAIVGSTFDIEILRRPGGAPTFVPYRIPTTGTPTHLIVQDIDVDGHPDIAYIDNSGSSSKLLIAYGTTGLPEAPVEVTQFQYLLAFVPIAIPDSNDPTNVIPDVAALTALPGPDPAMPFSMAQVVLTSLHGGPQRTLPAFADPRTKFPPSSQFASLVAGRFTGNPDPTISDVLAFEVHTPSSGDPQPTLTMWTIDGTAGAALAIGGTAFNAPDLTCGASSVALCADRAHFLAWSVGDHDVAIGIDDTGRIASIDASNPAQPVITPCDPMKCVAHMDGSQMRHAAVLGEGDAREVLVSYAPSDPNAPGGGVDACHVTAGVIDECHSFVADIAASVPELASWSCRDVDVGPLAPRGPFDPPDVHELGDALLLCQQGTRSVVWHVTRFDDGRYAATQMLEAPGAQFMVLADVTGDRVRDLLLVTFSSIVLPTMFVFPQCESRDHECRATYGGS